MGKAKPFGVGGNAPSIGNAAIAIFMAVASAGCYGSTQLVQVRKVEVTGPNHQIPVRITDGETEGHLRLTPNISVMQNRKIDGSVDIEKDPHLGRLSIYDTTDNVHWTMPSNVVGIALDYGLSKHFSFSLGGNYSKTNDKKSYEWDVGLGWCFYDQYLGGRFDFGFQWQDIAYSAYFDRYQSSPSGSGLDYMYTFNRYGRYVTGNFYGSITLNTVFRRFPLNAFVRAGYGVTSVLSDEMLRVNEEGDIAAYVGMLNVTPGLYFDLTRWSRLVVGCEFSSPVSMTSYSPEWLIVPTAQIDLSF